MRASIRKEGRKWRLYNAEGKRVTMPSRCGTQMVPIEARTRREVEQVCLDRMFYLASLAHAGIAAPVYSPWPNGPKARKK